MDRRLWPGGPAYEGDPVSGDSLALAAFVRGEGVRQVCDLGCGSGLLALLLCWEYPLLTAAGVELCPEAAERCRENLRRNGLDSRCRVCTADLRQAPLDPESFDLVVSNPPYFPAGEGDASPDLRRDRMRRESATLPQLCAAAARLLRRGGAFCLVHRTWRLAQVLSALQAAGLEPKRLRLMAHAPGAAPSLFLCESRRGGRPGLEMEPVLFQTGLDGRETAEYRRICHWAEEQE